MHGIYLLHVYLVSITALLSSHSGLVMHMYVGELNYHLVQVVADCCQRRTKPLLESMPHLSIGPPGTNFNDIWAQIRIFSLEKMLVKCCLKKFRSRLSMFGHVCLWQSSGKYRRFTGLTSIYHRLFAYTCHCISPFRTWQIIYIKTDVKSAPLLTPFEHFNT